MAINKASLIKVKSNQLPDAAIVASLTILLGSTGLTQMPKILGDEVRVMESKAVAIRAMVMVMVMAITWPML